MGDQEVRDLGAKLDRMEERFMDRVDVVMREFRDELKGVHSRVDKVTESVFNVRSDADKDRARIDKDLAEHKAKVLGISAFAALVLSVIAKLIPWGNH